LKISTRARYGVRALIDMAGQDSDQPIQLKDIAWRQEISVKYLEQIFAQLRTSGLVRGVRGPRGGYLLSKSPESMSICEVVEALDGSLSLVDCVDDPSACHRSQGCPSRRVWAEVSGALRDNLASISVADMGMPPAKGRAPRRKRAST